MFRSAPRLIARPGALRALPRHPIPARRGLSTAPPAHKSRSWKSLVARLGLAGAVVYYYNTTDVFADEPRHLRPVADAEKEDLPTIESIAEQRRERRAVQLQLERQREREAEEAAAAERLQADQEGGVEGQEAGIEGQEGGIEGLEAEADQQGAFNPETGEINWDCPCLGGMATGPCGDEFKAAFSCFVFSKEEPKGMDCIDKFKNMQNCFRQYPEVYGSEIDTDDDDDDMTADAAADVSTPTDAPPAPTLSGEPAAEPAAEPKPKSTPSGPHSPAKLAENRRELGLVPSSYRPAEDEASPDDEQKTQ